MTDKFEIRPRDFAGELRATARSLRDAGDVDLSRQMGRRITEAARPVLDEVRTTLGEYMPHRYADVLTTDLRLSTSRRLLNRAGARITLLATSRGSKKRKLRRLDEGVLEHPLFGDREHWYSQVAPFGGMRAGFFTDAARREAPAIRKKIVEAMNDTADEAARRH